MCCYNLLQRSPVLWNGIPLLLTYNTCTLVAPFFNLDCHLVFVAPRCLVSLCNISKTFGLNSARRTIWVVPFFSLHLRWRMFSLPIVKLGSSLWNARRSLPCLSCNNGAPSDNHAFTSLTTGHKSCWLHIRSKNQSSKVILWMRLRVPATVFLVPGMWWTLHWNSLNLSAHRHSRPLCSWLRATSRTRGQCISQILALKGRIDTTW